MPHEPQDTAILKNAPKNSAGEPLVLLVGNPNVGKSVIFSHLTGKYVTVSNYPGTTVEITRGASSFDGKAHQIIDTPGANSLIPRSEDEKVTRDVLLSRNSATVIQVADSKNLRRSLILTSQLAEMGIPMVLALNMADEAKIAGIHIDLPKLSERLGAPVIETVATEKRGINKLIASLSAASPSKLRIDFHPPIEEAIARLADILPPSPVSRGSLAVMLLAGDQSLDGWLIEKLAPVQIAAIEEIIQETQAHFHQPLPYLIGKRRLDAIDALLADVITFEQKARWSWLKYVGDFSQHPVWGFPVLAVVLYLMYLFVGKFGAGAAVDFIESTIFGGYINPAAVWLVQKVPSGFIQDLLVGEFGLITVGLTYAFAIVLPIVSFFFLAFGLLEDSGYLPRLTIMANRMFKIMGMNGKAVLPMVLGLGCDTMATLTTRILDTKKERIIATFLLALAIPCSAQLGVILGILGQISFGAFIVFATIILLQMLIVGFLAGKLVPGQRSDFIIEIPPFRLPQMSNVLIKTLSRVEWFLKEAVPLFLLGTLVLFVADRIGALDATVRAVQPIVVNFLSLPAETTVSFVMGFLRRDYGAAGLYKLYEQGGLDPTQVIVSLVVITLFIPCIANFFVIIKEHGLRRALVMLAIIFPLAILTGGIVNFVLRAIHYAG
jgi:ferrous iron transport protein B